MDKHTKGDRSHHAIDIYAKSGTGIVSPAGGTITRVKSGSKLGGTTVTVMGNDGIEYYFAHMSKHAPNLKQGQKILAGHTLGYVGNTGSAKRTKAHLHFSMKKAGKALNPYSHLRQAEADGGVMTLDMDLTGAEGHDDHAAHTAHTAEMEGGGMVDQMVASASNLVAGGQRLDPRTWIDPATEELDLTEGASDGSA